MSERQEIIRDNARPTKNSGRSKTAGEKGDARYPAKNSLITIDYKEASKSFNLNGDVLSKVNTDAAKNDDICGVLKVIFDGDTKTRVFIVAEDIFHEMMEAWCNQYGGA